MRRRSLSFSFALLFGGLLACLGQEPTGPATLDNVPEKDAVPAVQTAAQPGAPADPSQGRLVRPKDGVQHPDLDKAWRSYDAALAKATKRIEEVISRQFDAATDKGDLNAATKLRETLDKFKTVGELPSKTEASAILSNAIDDCKKAGDSLVRAYGAVIKSLTMNKKLAEATAAQGEQKALQERLMLIHGDTKPEPKPWRPNARKILFLSDLEEQDVIVGFGAFGKNGEMGFGDLKIKVRGERSPKGISMHGTAQGVSKVTYVVPDKCTHFEAIAAINDTAADQRTAVTFEVWGDEKRLWSSQPLKGAGRSEPCVIEIGGAKTLTLTVECPGDHHAAQAVWVEPCFTAR